MQHGVHARCDRCKASRPSSPGPPQGRQQWRRGVGHPGLDFAGSSHRGRRRQRQWSDRCRGSGRRADAGGHAFMLAMMTCVSRVRGFEGTASTSKRISDWPRSMRSPIPTSGAKPTPRSITVSTPICPNASTPPWVRIVSARCAPCSCTTSPDTGAGRVAPLGGDDREVRFLDNVPIASGWSVHRSSAAWVDTPSAASDVKWALPPVPSVRARADAEPRWM